MIELFYSLGHMNSGTWCSGHNLAGGIGVEARIIKNLGTKAIVSIDFYFSLYDENGQPVTCSLNEHGFVGVRFSKTLAPGGWATRQYWDNVWYNFKIKKAVLDKAIVRYGDETEETIPGDQIQTTVKSANGCYVATCVYGSYDCPEVWTLRRYRDDTLGASWYGRAFIRTYYAISPTLVKWFGKTKWFKKMWRGKLDRMVASLHAKGVEDTPYEDKNW